MLAHVAQRIGCALAVELVDRHEVGEVEHVDLLELRGRAELGRHDVQRHVDQRHDRRVTLADAGGLDDDQIEARDLARGDGIRERLADLGGGFARGHRTHVDVGAAAGADGIHTDAVTQKCAARLPPRRVDRDDSDPELVVLVEPEAANQFVCE